MAGALNDVSPDTLDAKHLGPAPAVEHLDQQFEQFFSKEVRAKERRNKFRFGALGAGVGGALGVAATGGAGLAVAGVALAAGVGGFSLSKRRGKKELQRQGVGDKGMEQCEGRPTLRRLRYLVRWGNVQLVEDEDSSADRRCRVLDEVVRAFSPWVQHMYLTRARLASASKGGEDVETKDILKHLAPLFFLLQRRTGVDTAALAAKLMIDDLNAGRGLSPTDVLRFRVTFPTILETISALDRLPAAVRAELLAKAGISMSNEDPEGWSKNRRRRLQRIVDAIGDVQGREDVEVALANPRNPVAVEESAPSTPAPSSSCSSPREAEPLEFPPDGIENEPGLAGADAQDEYLSLSEASDDEDPTQPTRAPASPKPFAAQSALIGEATFEQRSDAFPRGTGQPHTWMPGDPSIFETRGPTYFADRRKEPSGQCMLDLVGVDVSLVGDRGPIMRAALHPEGCVQQLRRRGDHRFFFVQTWVVPPLQATMVSAVDPEAAWLTDANSPQARSWRRFLQATPEGRREVFKIIPSIDEGPWLVRRSVPKKPVLLGKRVKMESYHEEGDHLEVVIDVASGKFEQRMAGLVIGATRALQISVASLIEARAEDELPECLLLSSTISFLDPGRLHHLAPA